MKQITVYTASHVNTGRNIYIYICMEEEDHLRPESSNTNATNGEISIQNSRTLVG
jgi:hypothetical protein